MASLYLLLSSIIFPVLAICWLCCIACCIYRSLIKALAKQGRTTKVQVGFVQPLCTKICTNLRSKPMLDRHLI